MNKIALITGASAGIGRAIAYNLAQNNYNLILIARREQLLQEIKQDLESRYGISVLVKSIDIRDKNIVYQTAQNLEKEWQKINVLINNAGLGTSFEPVDEAQLDDWQVMIDTNFSALLYVTHSFLPYLLQSGEKHIVNIGSTAAKQVKKGSNVYSATKFALEGFTRGLRIDLLDKGVRVTQINPGIVETEFALVRAKGDKEKAKSAYSGFTPLYPEDVADAVWFALSRPAHVNLNDIQLTSLIESDINHRLNKIVE